MSSDNNSIWRESSAPANSGMDGRMQQARLDANEPSRSASQNGDLIEMVDDDIMTLRQTASLNEHEIVFLQDEDTAHDRMAGSMMVDDHDDDGNNGPSNMQQSAAAAPSALAQAQARMMAIEAKMAASEQYASGGSATAAYPSSKMPPMTVSSMSNGHTDGRMAGPMMVQDDNYHTNNAYGNDGSLSAPQPTGAPPSSTTSQAQARMMAMQAKMAASEQYASATATYPRSNMPPATPSSHADDQYKRPPQSTQLGAMEDNLKAACGYRPQELAHSNDDRENNMTSPQFGQHVSASHHIDSTGAVSSANHDDDGLLDMNGVGVALPQANNGRASPRRPPQRFQLGAKSNSSAHMRSIGDPEAFLNGPSGDIAATDNSGQLGQILPGAYSVQARAIGAMPAWARPNNGMNGQHSSAHVSSSAQEGSSLSLRGAQSEPFPATNAGQYDHLPPEMRPPPQPQETNLPPELRGTQLSLIPHVARGSDATTVPLDSSLHQDSSRGMDNNASSRNAGGILTANVRRNSKAYGPSKGDGDRGSADGDKGDITQRAMYSALIVVLVLVVALVIVVALLLTGQFENSNDDNRATRAPRTERSDQTNVTDSSQLPSKFNPPIVPLDDPARQALVHRLPYVLPSSSAGNEQDWNDLGSARSKSVHWILWDQDLQTVSEVNQVDGRRLGALYSLAVFFYATGGESWTDDCNFLSKEHICDWNRDDNGIFCDGAKRVTQIIIESNNLNGTLPNDLSAFRFLQEITITGNPSLQGSIPETLLDSMFWLNILNLERNQLSGGLPNITTSVHNIAELHLGNNHLEGDVNLLGYLPRLVDVRLPQNRLSGHFVVPGVHVAPSGDGVVSAMLRRIDLGTNSFSGPLPTNLGRQLPSLEVLDVSENGFEGELPWDSFEHGSLPRLKFLLVNYNDLTGELPTDIGRFQSLINLEMKGNQIRGKIPESIGNCTNLMNLALSQTQLRGEVPTTLGNLNALMNLHLFSTLLEGRLPATLADAESLTRIAVGASAITSEGTQLLCDAREDLRIFAPVAEGFNCTCCEPLL